MLLVSILIGVGMSQVVLPTPFTGNVWLTRISAFPHVRFSMQPHGAAGGRELGGVLQEIRDRTLHLGRIEGEGLQLIIREKVESESFLLKTMRPQTADLGKAAVHVAQFILHLQSAGF